MPRSTKSPKWDPAVEWAAAQAITVQVNLQTATRQHLRMLRDVDQWPCLYQGPAATRAIYRYEEMWLPLCAAVQEGALQLEGGLPPMPPLDVHWVWHCHRLNPILYGRDCYDIYGKVLECPSGCLEAAEEAAAREATRRLWEERYPEEPFHLNLAQYESPSPELVGEVEKLAAQGKANGARPKLKHSLAARVKYQRDFGYNVAEPHYWDARFLKAAEERYRGFLHLMRWANGHFFVVPTYDVDLMWHTHQRFPGAYACDTLALFGRVLNHEEESDRAQGKRLDAGFRATCWLWERLYGGAYVRAGVLYRGKAPQEVPPARPLVAYPGEAQAGQDVNVGWGLQPRRLFKACIAVLAAQNVPANCRSQLCVTASSLASCPRLRLSTGPAAGSRAPRWSSRWQLECEGASEGLRLRLEVHTRGLRLLGQRPALTTLGEAVLRWDDAVEADTLSWNHWVELTDTKSRRTGGRARLHVDASVSAPQQGPYLLRTLPGAPTARANQSLPPGVVGLLTEAAAYRVVDHTAAERFGISMRRDENVGELAATIVEIHSLEGPGGAPLGTVSLTMDARNPTVRTWTSDSKWTLTITVPDVEDGRTGNSSELLHRVEFDLVDSAGPPLRLVPGRKLQYEVEGAPADEEEGFATLVRYVPGGLRGKATALLNWKTGAMEVAPEESSVLLLLVSTAMAASLGEIANPTRGSEGQPDRGGPQHIPRFYSPGTAPSAIDQWGAVIIPPRGSCGCCITKGPLSPWWMHEQLMGTEGGLEEGNSSDPAIW